VQEDLTDTSTRIFCELQDDESLNVVSRLLTNILVRKKAAPISEITVAEKQLALDLVSAMCVIHPNSRQYFGAHQYIEALVGFLRVEPLQVATLQALEGALVDSPANQEVRTHARERSSACVRADSDVAASTARLRVPCRVLSAWQVSKSSATFLTTARGRPWHGTPPAAAVTEGRFS